MPLKNGQTISWVRDDLPPLISPNTDLMVAWITCGGKLAEPHSFTDTVEQTTNGPKRTVTYMFDGASTVDFNGFEVGIGFDEFRRRWLDEAWISANADHPLAYVKNALKNSKIVRQWLREQKPAALIRRGNKVAFIPADCPEHRKQKILAEL